MKPHHILQIAGHGGKETVYCSCGGHYPNPSTEEFLNGFLAHVWDEAAQATRAAWDTDGEIVEPANPYRGEPL